MTFDGVVVVGEHGHRRSLKELREEKDGAIGWKREAIMAVTTVAMFRATGVVFTMLLVLLGHGSVTMAQALTERTNRGLVEVMTGRTDGTAIRMAEDLADLLDDGATRRILPIVGKGSLQNIVDVKALRGIDIALVQLDVLDHVRTEKLYPGIQQSLTYIAKLYDAEFHLLARGEVKSINDLAGQKVNFGPPGDGTATTGAAIFDLLKLKAEPTSYPSSLALDKLRSGEIAALAYVGGKPVPFFTALKHNDGFHFLTIPLHADVLGAYVPAQLTEEDYPGLITAGEPVDTVAVGTAMMVANLVSDSERYRNVVNFVDAFFTQFHRLQETPYHPKWREVNFAAEMPGWKRFPAADTWLKRNAVASASAPNEQQLREIFLKFLDERSRLSSGRVMSSQEKENMFNQFMNWQSRQTQ